MGAYGQSDIKAKVIKVIAEEKTPRAHHRLRIVAWIIDGYETPPRFEKREIRTDRNGIEFEGHCKGLTYRDMLEFLTDKDENLRLMQMPESKIAPDKNFSEPREAS